MIANRHALEGRFTRLHRIEEADERWIGEQLSEPEVALTWRPGGLALHGREMVQAVSSGVAVALMIRTKYTDENIGLAQLFNTNVVDAHGSLSVAIAGPYQRAGWPLEGVALFVDYVFSFFPLRKLYIHQSSPVKNVSGDLGRWLVQEGRLRNHDFRFGAYQDVYIFALYRDHWIENIRPRMLQSPP